LNDPARGIDIGAKLDLYRNLREFASRGNAVVFLSSEIEEFLNLCTRVLVFRNGSISAEFAPPYDGHVILNAMFGRKATARLPGEPSNENVEVAEFGEKRAVGMSSARFEHGRPMPRAVATSPSRDKPRSAGLAPFLLSSPDIAPGGTIPERFAEENKKSPRLVWSGVPEGTRSFAVTITDPDLPEEFKFPRSFAHWMVYDIPAALRELPEGASGSVLLPGEARELNSDFVTFGIPGFGRGYGGPWPPDRPHRYFFTVYALKVERLAVDPEADFNAFAAAVMPATIDSASFVAVYGPARKLLPA
jgi:Raf kinase inhibitor-like YbhB/YbcL family protein